MEHCENNTNQNTNSQSPDSISQCSCPGLAVLLKGDKMATLKAEFENHAIAAQLAFEQAIDQGRLSNNPADANYAGHYMYMGNWSDGKDTFKNINTRQYDI